MAVCAAVAAVVAALSGGPPPSAGALPAAATASAAVSASPAAAAGDPTSHASLTWTTTPGLIVPDVIASVPGGGSRTARVGRIYRVIAGTVVATTTL